MTMDISEDAINFDYERFPTEYFILEASDGLTTTQISIRFNILDQNDVSVRINLGVSKFVIKLLVLLITYNLLNYKKTYKN